MAPSVTLRLSTPDDQEFLFAVYASTRDEELSLSGWDDNQKRAFNEMQFHAQSQQYRLCYPQADSGVILLDDHPVGRLLVDRKGADFTHVDIALLPEYRNRGIGTTLIQSLLKEATGAQKNVALHVLRWSSAARLYERLGFTMVSEDGVYLEMKRIPPGEDHKN
jgi:ribosomal protein S18 acetylase RimI-like enzyme